MTQLLLHGGDLQAPGKKKLRTVARARTLTVLRVLDGVRKATILQFLNEAGLITSSRQEKDKLGIPPEAIVSLAGANLVGANLEGAELVLAELKGANLERACLNKAHLNGANLEGANLRGANLREANLEGAFLDEANLEGANLQGATMPDGSKNK
jgi:hypothetical protein